MREAPCGFDAGCASGRYAQCFGGGLALVCKGQLDLGVFPSRLATAACCCDRSGSEWS